MKTFKEYFENKIEESDIGLVEPGLDKGNEKDPYHFNDENPVIIKIDEDHKNYKLTKQDKKMLKELFEKWHGIKFNIETMIETFEEKNIYRNDIAYYRVEKAKKLSEWLDKVYDMWMSRKF